MRSLPSLLVLWPRDTERERPYGEKHKYVVYWIGVVCARPPPLALTEGRKHKSEVTLGLNYFFSDSPAGCFGRSHQEDIVISWDTK